MASGSSSLPSSSLVALVYSAVLSFSCLAVLGGLELPPHHLLQCAAAARLEVPIFQSSSCHPLAQGTFYPLLEGFFPLVLVVFIVLTVGLVPQRFYALSSRVLS